MSHPGRCWGTLGPVATLGLRHWLSLQPRMVGITPVSTEGHEDWEIKLPVQTA